MESYIYIYPTDTVWGIGAPISSALAHKKIFEIKQTSPRPFSILFSDVEMIKDYFTLPEVFSGDWLSYFFSRESTLGIPRKWAKKEIPLWITQDSPYIAFRYLPLKYIKKITAEIGCPLTTTSLNISGEPPITSYDKACQFYKNIKAKTNSDNINLKFYENGNSDSDSNSNGSGNNDLSCSGNASTIVIFDQNGEPVFLRKGRFAAELEKYCGLLST